MIIVILGPDGSGKTTLAKALADNIKGLSYIYFGNNPQSREYAFFKKFLKNNREGKINTFLKYIFIFINDYHYYKISRRTNLIADRCPIDKELGSILNGHRFRYLYHKFTLAIMPKPDFVILLHGDVDVLYERKKEISRSTIEQYVHFYRNYLSKHKIENIEIDTTKNDIKNTFETSFKSIVELI